jgi:hypothetical protein
MATTFEPSARTNQISSRSWRANHLFKPLSMLPESARPAGRPSARERLEPGLLDRLGEMRSFHALKLGRSRATVRVRLEIASLELTGHPHAEVESEGERRATHSVSDARGERLEVEHVHCRLDVAPRKTSGERVEALTSQDGPDDSANLTRDVPRVHELTLAASRRLDEPLAHPPLVLEQEQPAKLRGEDRHAEARSRPCRAGCVLRTPLSPEEEIRGRSGFWISHRRGTSRA